MEITINQRKQLYRQCFDDSEVYTDGFFKLFYNGKNATDIVIDGVLAASMYTKLQFLYLGSKAIPCEFIMGLGVHPDYRKNGLATKLLSKYLNATEMPFAALHPFDRNFYKKQGFVPYNFAAEDTCKATRSVLKAERVRDPERIRIFVERARKKNLIAPFPFPPVLEPLDTKFNEIKLELDDGAEFHVLYADDDFEGYAVVKDKEILFYEVFDRFHLNDVESYKGYQFFNMPASNTVYNMARAVNVERLLYEIPYAESNARFDFVLKDDRVPKNDGVYRVVVQNGKCAAVIRRLQPYGLPVVTTEQLTLLALGQGKKVKGDAAILGKNFYNYRIKDLTRY